MPEFERVVRQRITIEPMGAQGDNVLINIYVNRTEDRAWLDLYSSGDSGLRGPDELMDSPPPIRSNGVIQLHCHENSIDAYVKHIDDRLRAANDQFEQQVMTRREREAEQQQRSSDELEQRRAALRQRAADIPPPAD